MEITKDNLRSTLLTQRNSMSVEERLHKSKLACHNFNQYFTTSKRYIIAGYCSFNNEIDINEIINTQFNKNQQICLPCIINNQDIIFRLWDQTTPLSSGLNYKILEPNIVNKEVFPNIIIAPLIGVDIKGNRVGYGLGYYDKYLAKLKMIKEVVYIGICYDFQIVDMVPSENLDQNVDIIVSDKRVITINPQIKF